jgi:DNA polymerase-1
MFPNIEDIDKKYKRFNLLNRPHSLKSWGIRLGEEKIDYHNFSFWTPEMQTYCEQDIITTKKLYEYLNSYKYFIEGECLEIENKFSKLMSLQREVGIVFDMKNAVDISNELQSEVNSLEEELKSLFSPIIKPEKLDEEGNPIVKQFCRRDKRFGSVNCNPEGDRVKPFIGATYCPVKIEEFNPSSRQQIAARLKNKYNVKFDTTDKGSPKVDSKVLQQLPFPEAAKLVTYLDTNKFLSQLGTGDKSWFNYAVEREGVYRIHGSVNSQGALTGRCTHSNPNAAQVPKTKRARSLFLPQEGYLLAGCDASSLEARILAHFLYPYDEGSYRDKFLSGADVHEENRELFSLFSRGSAKTLWYGIQYGSGNKKAGLIAYNDLLEVKTLLTCFLARKPLEDKQLLILDRAENLYKIFIKEKLLEVLTKELNNWDYEDRGKKLKQTVYEQIPALKKLLDAINTIIDKRGFIYGLDKRKIYIAKDKKYKALNYLIQGAGAIAMKKAAILLHEKFLELGLKYYDDFAFVLNVHDEFQMQILPVYKDLFLEYAPWSIREAGAHFKLRCPLDGEAKIGNNWSETH